LEQYWTIPTSDGMIYSQGQGLLTTQDSEITTYTQQAVGQINRDIYSLICSLFSEYNFEFKVIIY
jgi:hypothetical protein